MLSPEARRRLEDVLVAAQAQGALGPGPVGEHVDHALGFAEAATAPPARCLDLGTGAGIPGLPLALVWPEAHVTLLDARARRTRLLEIAVRTLELGSRVTVVRARAEDLAHDPEHREAYDLVVARGFGPPSTTAECAAGLVAPGGALVVSEPPVPSPERWPAEALAGLGFDPAHPTASGGRHFAVIDKRVAADPRWPRSSAALAKRPLWTVPA